jgi:septum site-determining protein MinC
LGHPTNLMLKAAHLACAANGSGLPHRLSLAAGDQPALAEVSSLLADARLQNALPPGGRLALELGSRRLTAQELAELRALLAEADLELTQVAGQHPHSQVAAAGLGLGWQEQAEAAPEAGPPLAPRPLTVHQGTLRSGDHLEAEGAVLVLGDVNPGARVTAAGHVLVWGQLRGVAHAGCRGDRTARIVALQLRPVQLRIADLVARGPADAPPNGLAEQAVIEAGEISIEPAQPSWPLG